MLTNTAENFVISNLGWVDGGGLWTFRVGEQRARRAALGNAKYLTLHAGTDDHFSVVHHDERSRVEITVHHFDDPVAPLGRAVVEADGSTVTGPTSIWSHVQTNYTAFYKGPFWSDYALVRVDPGKGNVSLQQFDWYNDEYDKGYQGVIGVTEIPGDSLVPQQRAAQDGNRNAGSAAASSAAVWHRCEYTARGLNAGRNARAPA